jgi:excisionase family DNA binding protein
MDAVRDAGMDGSEARVTVAEAAERLSITKEAVRKRIHRGTLRSDRAPDGTVMVYVPASTTADGTPSSPDGAIDLLYQEMRERIAYLEHQVEEEREARRRADMLLARLVERVPEIEAPQDASESPAPRSDAPTPTDAGGEHEEAVEDQRGWFRRFFGV